ncbi:hypothetical protein TNIN_273921 [Trichonephila inaurata madagascariensis]|uniref:Uncharacterized protein n=1 Tax=Trichonephila inaurata madagascariensis TaxID=2747483 RepID=A0A8X6X9Z6_9ARAC|nr:hypothetical protein TNIN_273921 [Trichonephila inaurata madagascariensis]
MTTILTEIEAVPNLRPLICVYEENDKPRPLTPMQFLNFGQSQPTYPVTKKEVNLFLVEAKDPLFVRGCTRRTFSEDVLKLLAFSRPLINSGETPGEDREKSTDPASCTYDALFRVKGRQAKARVIFTIPVLVSKVLYGEKSNLN